MKEALAALFALQQVDSALMLARRRLGALDPGTACRSAAQAAAAVHKAASDELHRLSGELHASELEQKSVEAKRKDFETKLYGGRVTAFKELESMQQEIESLGRQASRLDDRILDLMDRVDAQRVVEADARKDSEAKDALLAEAEGAFAKSSAALTSEIQRLSAERERLAAPISAQLMRRYDHVRSHCAGVGIARIDNGLCGACHTSLPSKQMGLVEQGVGIETCDSCARMLCWMAE